MVRHCVVKGCQPDRYNFRISQYQFPKDADLRERWVKFVQLGRGSLWQPKHWHLMCSRHFPDSCFDTSSMARFKTSSNSRLVMLENAVPSLHGYLLGQGPVRMLDIDKVKVDGTAPEVGEGVEDYEDAWCDESSTLQQARKDFLQQMQERLKKPKKVKDDPESLPRGPPDVTLPISELNALLTCGICKGYIINATTITECLHSFCRSCLINHVKGSVLCPTCSTVIHPSNPFSNMRADWTMQDIVFKIFPHVEKDEKLKEAEFYRSRGLQWPPKETEVAEEKEERPARPVEVCPSWVSMELQNTGVMPGTPTVGSLKTLPKCFIRIPCYTTLAHIKLYVEAKLNVHKEAQVYLFLDNYVLHPSLTVEDIWNIFFAEEEEGVYPLQYGVVRSPLELFVRTLPKAKNKYHRKIKHWPDKSLNRLYNKGRPKGRPGRGGRRGRPRLRDQSKEDDTSRDQSRDQSRDHSREGSPERDQDSDVEMLETVKSHESQAEPVTLGESNTQETKTQDESGIHSNQANGNNPGEEMSASPDDEEALASFLDEQLAHCNLNSDSRADTPTLLHLNPDSRLDTPTLESIAMSSPAEIFDEALASIAQLL